MTTIGPDQLRVKIREDPHDGRPELYADDSTASASGRTWEEAKGKMNSTLQHVFENMKAARLKVNREKTKLLIIKSYQKRRAAGGLAVSMAIGGKEVKPETSALCKKRGLYFLDWIACQGEPLSEKCIF